MGFRRFIAEELEMKCVKCNKECREERVRVRRDDSVVIRAIHNDNSPDHTYSEWPSVSAFINRKYPGDASRRSRK
jgi:hypothetical protein